MHLNSITLLAFVMESYCVYCREETVINTVYMSFADPIGRAV